MTIPQPDSGRRPPSLTQREWDTYVDAYIDSGWEVLPVGREHKGQFKAPWVGELHGHNTTSASASDLKKMGRNILARIEKNPELGILALAVRMPPGVIGIDIDAHSGKKGADTLARWETERGPLEETYAVTARTDDVSGIRLFTAPTWFNPQEADGVEFILPWHRYAVAPPSWHHTGQRYRQRIMPGPLDVIGPLPDPETLPALGKRWLDLPQKPDSSPAASWEDVKQFAFAHNAGTQTAASLEGLTNWLLENQPSRHDAAREALNQAAREAKGGRYPFDEAVRTVRNRVKAAFDNEGGRGFDLSEFKSLMANAVGQAAPLTVEQCFDGWQLPGMDTASRLAAEQDWNAYTPQELDFIGSDGGKGDTDPTDVERRIEREVQRELERLEIRRRVAEHQAQAKIDVGADRAVSGLRFLQEDSETQAVWGRDSRVLMAAGEGCMLTGPQGVGKSTVAQQLALSVLGVGPPELLGFPVATSGRPVLYLAMDRPPQIRRSFARMVNQADGRTRQRLEDQLVVWRGPTPVKANESPAAFAEWVRRRGREPGLLVVDSLKDLVSGLTDDADGIGFNDAVQKVLADLQCEVLTLHHHRKSSVGNVKPNKLDDVYGNTWLTAGQGSVVLLWGQPGDASVELSHLKQPQEKVGPLTVNHTHLAGASAVVDVSGRLLSLAMGWHGSFTVRDIGPQVFELAPGEDLSESQRSKLRRELKKLSDPTHGVLEEKTGTAVGSGGGKAGSVWRAK